MVGRFNAYNILSVYATAIFLGFEKIDVLTALSNINPVAGRFQYVISPDKITAIVDYAHTPDALKNVLKTVEDIRTRNEDSHYRGGLWRRPRCNKTTRDGAYCLQIQ